MDSDEAGAWSESVLAELEGLDLFGNPASREAQQAAQDAIKNRK